MSVVLVTGSAGLIGSEAARHFAALGLDVIGVDNDMRGAFFGPEASTRDNQRRLESELTGSYRHVDLDIRDREGVLALVASIGADLELVVHCAAQPSHDWAAREPFTDFDINAVGTLNLLEAVRRSAPSAVFIFTSTNKVYGDAPNELPFVEGSLRWDLPEDHPWRDGIPETLRIDSSLHSLFGASKIAADVLVQEYGRYFDLRTVCFRGGTLTGPAHAATELHGFLAYVMRCTMTGTPYRVFGYKGKQVRDAIHSTDLVAAFDAFWRAPRVAEVYNIGGGPTSNCSVLEAIELSQVIANRELDWTYVDQNRIGDHIWWVSGLGKFHAHYPGWRLEYDVKRILEEIYEVNRDRWVPAA